MYSESLISKLHQVKLFSAIDAILIAEHNMFLHDENSSFFNFKIVLDALFSFAHMFPSLPNQLFHMVTERTGVFS